MVIDEKDYEDDDDNEDDDEDDNDNDNDNDVTFREHPQRAIQETCDLRLDT